MRMSFFILSIAATIPASAGARQRAVFYGNAIYPLCECSTAIVLQLVLHHLAGGVQRQLVDELYIPRHLETGHAIATPGDQLLGRRGAVTVVPGILGYHEGLADL